MILYHTYKVFMYGKAHDTPSIQFSLVELPDLMSSFVASHILRSQFQNPTDTHTQTNALRVMFRTIYINNETQSTAKRT